MRVTKQIVTMASLNALAVNGEIALNVFITKADGSIVTPHSIRIDNGTGANLGITIIENQNEVAEKLVHPEWYVPIPLDSGKIDLNIGLHGKTLIITKLVAGVATADLTLYPNNFFE